MSDRAYLYRDRNTSGKQQGDGVCVVSDRAYLYRDRKTSGKQQGDGVCVVSDRAYLYRDRNKLYLILSYLTLCGFLPLNSCLSDDS